MKNLLVLLGVLTALLMLFIALLFGLWLGHTAVAALTIGVLAGFVVHVGQIVLKQERHGQREMKR